MKFLYVVLGGVLLLLIGFASKRLQFEKLKYLPHATARLGKAWGRTTDRYMVSRSLNSFFYITGLIVTLAGAGMALHSVINSRPLPRVAIVRPDNVNELNATEVLRLVNEQRTSKGLEDLKPDNRLNALAQQRLDDMIQNQYYAHLGSNDKYFYQMFPDYKIASRYACENLDIEFTVDERVYVNDWLTSTKGHRECMLNKDVTSTGYAVGLFDETSETKIYLVVAIHSTPITTLKNQ